MSASHRLRPPYLRNAGFSYRTISGSLCFVGVGCAADELIWVQNRFEELRATVGRE